MSPHHPGLLLLNAQRSAATQHEDYQAQQQVLFTTIDLSALQVRLGKSEVEPGLYLEPSRQSGCYSTLYTHVGAG